MVVAAFIISGEDAMISFKGVVRNNDIRLDDFLDEALLEIYLSLDDVLLLVVVRSFLVLDGLKSLSGSSKKAFPNGCQSYHNNSSMSNNHTFHTIYLIMIDSILYWYMSRLYI